MRKTTLVLTATVCAACLAFASLVVFVGIEARPAHAAATTYTLTDLGTLGGATIARDINEAGQVAGQSQNAQGTPGQNRAFLWESGRMTDLGTLGGTTSAARGIDDSGRVVGFSRTSSNQLRAFLVQRGTGGTPSMSSLGTLTGFTSSEAWDINDSGVAAGRSFTSASQGRAVLWENGQIRDLSATSAALKTPYSEAWSINNFGQVVGEAGNADQQAKAFLYDDNTGGVTDLDALIDRPEVFPDAYPYSEAMGINDRGQVVGWAYKTTNPGPEGEAFLYEKDANGAATMLPLNPLGKDRYSRARDIDESGRVVGWSRGTEGNDREQFSATLWEGGQVTDLNELIPADSRWRLTDDGTISGWKLVDAYAISESGQIVGSGFKDGNDSSPNQIRAFLLTPNDTTAPNTTASISPEPNAAGWNDEDVTVTLKAADEGGSNVEGITYSASGAQPIDDQTVHRSLIQLSVGAEGETSITYSAKDHAGNAEEPQTLTVRIDKTGPEVSIVSPADGAEYVLDEPVAADYACSDGVSGLVSCVGTVPDGDAVDTASVGQKFFVVEAGDKAGNAESETSTYNVIYDFDGFFSPVDNPEVLNRAKAGSAIPVKFSLGGDQGLDVFADAPDGSSFPKSGPIPCDSTDPVDAVEQTVSANSSGLTYDATTDVYTYVWKTRRDWTGCRQLVVRLGDGKEYTANFAFSK